MAKNKLGFSGNLSWVCKIHWHEVWVWHASALWMERGTLTVLIRGIDSCWWFI